MIDAGALATLWPLGLIAVELPEPNPLAPGNPRQHHIDHDGGSMSTFNYPDEWDRAELAGRLYQAIDIETAIRAGRFGSLDELVEWLTEQADLMTRVQNCRLWLMCTDQPGCLDLHRTLARVQRPERSRL